MYTKTIPYKDFKGNARNESVSFNLTEPEVFKLLVELKAIFDWRDRIKSDDVKELPAEEIVEFYSNFERVLLEAWGVPSEDGKHFRKDGRYDFQESALFAAAMMEFVSNPEETMKLLDGLMPKGLQDVVKKADANMERMENSDQSSDELKAEIARLRAQLPSSERE